MLSSACPVCSQSSASTISTKDRKGGDLKTVLCGACGHVYNDPIPSAAELASFYAIDYRVQYKGRETPRGRQIVRNFERAEEFWRQWGSLIGSGPRILDVGAGSGEFLFLAQGLGYDASGIEPNQGYASYCRDALGLRVESCRLDEIRASGQTYDFIRLNHVLEHLPNPQDSLETIRDMLSPDGLLYVEVPNVSSYAQIRTRGRMFHYGHISNFSPWTLRAVAARAGLEEHPDCVAEQADQTATFFRKGPAADASSAQSALNAAAIAAVIDAHYRSGPAIFAKAAKLLRKLAARSKETVTAGRVLGSPQAIGDHYLDRLKLSVQPLARVAEDV